MNKIQYQAHRLLNTKYILFMHIFIYILIIIVYNLYINEINITECMDREVPIAPGRTYIDYTRHLELENKLLKERIALLENNLRNEMEQAYLNKLTYDAMLNSLAEKNRVLQSRIDETFKVIDSMFEENNALHQIIEEQKEKK